MNLNFTIDNPEDIQFLKNYDDYTKNIILKSAITIGLRSIQMGETNLDCKSYLNPILEISDLTTKKSFYFIKYNEFKKEIPTDIKHKGDRKSKIQ